MNSILSDDKDIKKIIKTTTQLKLDFNNPDILVSVYSSNLTIFKLFEHGVSEVFFKFNNKSYHVKKDQEVDADVLEFMKTEIVKSGIEIKILKETEADTWIDIIINE